MMIKRIPKNYSGSLSTSRSIKKLLPHVLNNFSKKYNKQNICIFKAWEKIIGKSLFKMTKVVSFKDGVLRVRVSNSTLKNLLSEYEKSSLLKSFKNNFPKLNISDILFFIG